MPTVRAPAHLARTFEEPGWNDAPHVVIGTAPQEAADRSTSAQIFARWFSRVMRSGMAEYGEWNRKGAVLSDVTAHKEYGVTRDFIVKGIQAGKLEYRQGGYGAIPISESWSLELFIAEQLGSEHLSSKKAQTELLAINKEIAEIRKKLTALEARKLEIEACGEDIAAQRQSPPSRARGQSARSSNALGERFYWPDGYDRVTIVIASAKEVVWRTA